MGEVRRGSRTNINHSTNPTCGNTSPSCWTLTADDTDKNPDFFRVIRVYVFVSACTFSRSARWSLTFFPPFPSRHDACPVLPLRRAKEDDEPTHTEIFNFRSGCFRPRFARRSGCPVG